MVFIRVLYGCFICVVTTPTQQQRNFDFDQTLKVDSWDHFEQIPTVLATFVEATMVLAIFVHIRIISAVTDPILTKL